VETPTALDLPVIPTVPAVLETFLESLEKAEEPQTQVRGEKVQKGKVQNGGLGVVLRKTPLNLYMELTPLTSSGPVVGVVGA
jgi:hypothetical protein